MKVFNTLRTATVFAVTLILSWSNLVFAQEKILSATPSCVHTIGSAAEMSADSIRNELKSFITSVKPETIKQGLYNVYMIRVFADSTREKAYCYTLGYIYNWFEMNYISFNYYADMDGEIVLMLADQNAPKVFRHLGFEKANTTHFQKAYSKLYPPEKGGITGFAKGKVICVSDNQVEKMHYPDEDDISPERSIFTHRLSKESIREINISETLRR